MEGSQEDNPLNYSYVDKSISYNPEKSRKSWAKAAAIRKQQEEEAKNFERILSDRRKNMSRYKVLLKTLSDEVENLEDIIEQYEVDGTQNNVSPLTEIELPGTTMAAVTESFNKASKAAKESEDCRRKLDDVEEKIAKLTDEIKGGNERITERIQQIVGNRDENHVVMETRSDDKTLQEIAEKRGLDLTKTDSNDSNLLSSENSSISTSSSPSSSHVELSESTKDEKGEKIVERVSTITEQKIVEQKNVINDGIESSISLENISERICQIERENGALKEEKVKITQKYEDQLNNIRKQLDESANLLSEAEATYNNNASKYSNDLNLRTEAVSNSNKIFNESKANLSEIIKNKEMALNHLKELKELISDSPMMENKENTIDSEKEDDLLNAVQMENLTKTSEKFKGIIEKGWECYTQITGEEYETVLANEINEISLIKSQVPTNETINDSNSLSRGIENEGIFGMKQNNMESMSQINESIINEGIMNESIESSLIKPIQTHPVYISGLAVPPIPYMQIGDFLSELLETVNYVPSEENNLKEIFSEYMTNGRSNNENTSTSSPKMIINLKNVLNSGLSVLTTKLSSSASEISLLTVRNSEIMKRIGEIDKEIEDIQEKLSCVLGEDEWRVIECVRSGEKEQEERKKALLKERNELVKELRSRREKFEIERANLEQKNGIYDPNRSPKPIDIKQCTETLQNNKKITNIQELVKSINIVTQQRNLLSSLLLSNSQSSDSTKQDDKYNNTDNMFDNTRENRNLGKNIFSGLKDDNSKDTGISDSFHEIGNRFARLAELQEEYLNILRTLDRYRLKVKMRYAKEPVVGFSQTLPNTMTATNSRLNLNNPLIEYLTEFYELSNDLTNKRLFITMVEQYITSRNISTTGKENVFLSPQLLSDTLKELLTRKKELGIELIQVKSQIVSLNGNIDQSGYSDQNQAEINRLYEYLESRVEYPLSAITRIVASYLPQGINEYNISPSVIISSAPLSFAINKPLGSAIAEYRASNDKLAKLYKIILEEISNAAFKVVNAQGGQNSMTISPRPGTNVVPGPVPHVFTPTYYHLVVKDPSIVVKGFNLYKTREREMETLRNGDNVVISRRSSSLNEQQISRVVAKLHELDEWLKTANAVLTRYNNAGNSENLGLDSTTIKNTSEDKKSVIQQNNNVKDNQASAQLLSLATSFQNIEFILLSRLNKINNELKWLEKNNGFTQKNNSGKHIHEIPDSVLLEKYLADSYSILNGISLAENLDLDNQSNNSGCINLNNTFDVSGINTITNTEETIRKKEEEADSTKRSPKNEKAQDSILPPNPLTPVLNERSDLNARLVALQTERKTLINEYQTNQQTTISNKNNIGNVQNQIDATRVILGCIQPLCILEDIVYNLEILRVCREKLDEMKNIVADSESVYLQKIDALNVLKDEMKTCLAPYKTALESKKEIYESYKRQHEQIIEIINDELKDKEKMIERNNEIIDKLKKKARRLQDEIKEAEEYLKEVSRAKDETVNFNQIEQNNDKDISSEGEIDELNDEQKNESDLTETKKEINKIKEMTNRLKKLKNKHNKLKMRYEELERKRKLLCEEYDKILMLLDSEIYEILVNKNSSFESTRNGSIQRGNTLLQELDIIKGEVERANDSNTSSLLSSPPSAAAQRSFEKDVLLCNDLRSRWTELTDKELMFKKIQNNNPDEKPYFTLNEIGEKTEDNTTPSLRACGLEDLLNVNPSMENQEIDILNDKTFLRAIESSELIAGQQIKKTPLLQQTLSLHPTPLFEKTVEVYTGKQVPQSRLKMSPPRREMEAEYGEVADFPFVTFSNGERRFSFKKVQSLFHQFAANLFSHPDYSSALQAKTILKSFGAFGSEGAGIPCKMANGLPSASSNKTEPTVVMGVSADLRRMIFRNLSSGRSSFILCQELKELRVASLRASAKFEVVPNGEIVSIDMGSSSIPPPLTVYFAKRTPMSLYTRNASEFLWIVSFIELMICAAGVNNGIFRLRCFVSE